MSNEENFWSNSFEQAFNNAYDQEHADFKKIKKEKLIISLIGSVNAGKSTTINALFGKNLADVKARAGWTKNITLYEFKENVFIADTPGLHDINKEIIQNIPKFIANDSDIILFFLNATVGITSHEKEAFERMKPEKKEIVVILNKIDALEEEELKDVMNQIQEEIDYKPFPISAKHNIGIKELNDHIHEILKKKGKELLFLKISKDKEETVAKWINGATASALGFGALPVPGSDIVPLTGLQVGLALKIAFIYECEVTKKDIMTLVGQTVTGTLGKQIARYAITALKATGWIPGAQLVEVATCAVAGGIAASITYAFGWACNEYYKRDCGNVDLDFFKDVFNKRYEEYRKKEKS